MGHLRKVYSNRRPRGGTPGKRTVSASSETGNTPRDYSRTVQQYHGAKTNEVMETLSRQIEHKRRYH